MGDYKVLIVDYEPRAVEDLRSALEALGLHVLVATDGLSGAQAAQTQAPQIAFVEAMLPKRSGLELCQDLRKAGFTQPLVLMASRFAAKRYRHPSTYGANAFLVKPFETEELHAILAKVAPQLERRQAPRSDLPDPAASGPAASGPAASGPAVLAADTAAIATAAPTAVAAPPPASATRSVAPTESASTSVASRPAAPEAAPAAAPVVGSAPAASSAPATRDDWTPGEDEIEDRLDDLFKSLDLPGD